MNPLSHIYGLQAGDGDSVVFPSGACLKVSTATGGGIQLHLPEWEVRAFGRTMAEGLAHLGRRVGERIRERGPDDPFPPAHQPFFFFTSSKTNPSPRQQQQ
jgi:hypothetical protein